MANDRRALDERSKRQLERELIRRQLAEQKAKRALDELLESALSAPGVEGVPMLADLRKAADDYGKAIGLRLCSETLLAIIEKRLGRSS